MALGTEPVRARLTLFHVAVLGLVLFVVGGLTYVLLARILYARVDEGLLALVQIATTSLGNDLAEGQDTADAARSTAAELGSRQQMLAIYDEGGQLLAESGRDDDLQIRLPPLDRIPAADPLLTTEAEPRDEDDRHRLAMRRVTLAGFGTTYIVVAGSSLEPIDEELEAVRATLAYVVPVALLLAAVSGWFLARRSLAPVQFAMQQQRRFMADASHELRTPVTTTRTAANVALQQPHRPEEEYRRSLAIIEQQADRLSRIVEDMFTLARADAGTYPVRKQPMYLDELIDEVVAAARVLASTRGVVVRAEVVTSAAYEGDEELVRRAVVNLLDNAVRHSPSGATVVVRLQRASGGYTIAVADEGPGIPPESQPHIFERFYRADASRAREGRDGGAGLGLALVRWVAQLHGGDATLTSSSDHGSTFTVVLPSR